MLYDAFCWNVHWYVYSFISLFLLIYIIYVQLFITVVSNCMHVVMIYELCKHKWWLDIIHLLHKLSVEFILRINLWDRMSLRYGVQFKWKKCQFLMQLCTIVLWSQEVDLIPLWDKVGVGGGLEILCVYDALVNHNLLLTMEYLG